MRSRAAVGLALVLLASACGGGDTRSAPTDPPTGSLAALWKRPGEDIALLQGTGDYAPGRIRVSFLVVGRDGRPVERPRARVWLATGKDERPFLTTAANLERVGVPGGYEDDHGVKGIYVTHLRVLRPGTYWLLAEPVGGRAIQGLATLVVKRRTASPEVGERALPSRTPTIASTRGKLELLTTRVPPDRELLRHSIADAVAAGKPFVVVFATPRFCMSRTCGPVVDIVDAVRRRFARSDVRFIHVEIYERNDPKRGLNRWVREWGLPSEPWTFVVDRRGRIASKFEGSVSVRELTRAVREVA